MNKIIDARFEKIFKRSFNKIGSSLVASAQKNMDRISYGRRYKIGGRVHVASKKGDSANNLSGDLRETIRYEIKNGVMEFGAGDTKVDYAKYLEYKKILDRPNFKKSIRQNKGLIKKEIENQIKRGVVIRSHAA